MHGQVAQGCTSGSKPSSYPGKGGFILSAVLDLTQDTALRTSGKCMPLYLTPLRCPNSPMSEMEVGEGWGGEGGCRARSLSREDGASEQENHSPYLLRGTTARGPERDAGSQSTDR